MRRLLPLLLLAFAAAPATAVASSGPCVPGQGQPRCNFQTAKVTFIADGDTIRVHMPGSRAVKTIRFTGINAMELHRYSKYANRRRGECHGVAATAVVQQAIKRSHGTVRLGDQRADSKSGERLRRSVWAHYGGRWHDIAKMELEKGLVLWLPNGVEWAHNREYHRLAARAAAARKGLYDPTSCGKGPNDDLALRMWVNWDATGNDDQNLNDEWVQLLNDGNRRLPLKGWWLRDSWLNWAKAPSGKRVPGYPFPNAASIPAGGSIRVHVGCGHNSATDFYWCQKTSAFENVTTDSNALGDGGYLFDPQGDLRTSSIYACVLACSDPAKGRAQVDVHPNNPESVSVTNSGSGDLDLYGYLLKIHNPGVADSFIASYEFGPNAVLGPGETLQVDLTGSSSNDSRLRKHWGLPSNVLRDRQGAASLRTFTDIVIDCHSWGSGHC
jgi:endonuclease YncB( thermonuclease family)